MKQRDYHEYQPCDNCGELTHCDDICEVPYARPRKAHWSNPDGTEEMVRLCCDICYDEVCDEEGFNPQDDV